MQPLRLNLTETTQGITLLFWWKRYDGNFKCSQAVRTLPMIQQFGFQKLWSSLCQCLAAQGSHRKVSGTDMQKGASSNQEAGNLVVMRQVRAQARKSICWPGTRAAAREGHWDRAEHGPGLAAPMAGTVGTWGRPCCSITVWGAGGHGGCHGVLPWRSPSGQAGPVGALSILVVLCSRTASH